MKWNVSSALSSDSDHKDPRWGGDEEDEARRRVSEVVKNISIFLKMVTMMEAPAALPDWMILAPCLNIVQIVKKALQVLYEVPEVPQDLEQFIPSFRVRVRVYWSFSGR